MSLQKKIVVALSVALALGTMWALLTYMILSFTKDPDARFVVAIFVSLGGCLVGQMFGVYMSTYGSKGERDGG